MHTGKNKFFLALVFFISMLFVCAPKASASTTVSAAITANTTWTLSGSPYILTGQIQVSKGVTLTIQPGVSVTSPVNFLTYNFSTYPGAALVFVGSSLVADGTASQPIHIDDFSIGLENYAMADIADASVQGVIMGYSTATLNSVTTGAIDASGHNTITANHTTITGDSTLPTFIAGTSMLTMNGGAIDSYDPNRAEAIEFSGSQGSLTNTAIQSSTVGIYMEGSFVDAENVVIEDCATAVQIVRDPAAQGDNNDLWLHNSEVSYNGSAVAFNGSPTFSVTGNSFHDNGAGVTYSGTATFNFKSNWWGSASGPFNATSNPSGKGASVSATIAISPWLTAAPFAAIILPALTAPPTPVPTPDTTSSQSEDSTTATSTAVSDTVIVTTDDADATDADDLSSDTASSTFVASASSTDTAGSLDADSDADQTATTTDTSDVSVSATDADRDQSDIDDTVLGASEPLLISDGTPPEDTDPPPAAPTHTPVLIVPGVLGTELSGDTGKLWLDLAHSLTDIGSDYMDPLQFTNDLTPSDPSVKTGDIMRSESLGIVDLFDYSKGLIDEFESQGYAEGTDLFVFPYDWRYGVSQSTVDQLGQKIAAIEAETGSVSVDVVAHSTGGLVVKKYVSEHPTDSGIAKAVFVGVPNDGAPKAIKTLLEGDSFGVPLLIDAEMKKLAQNFPVVYDLAPSAAYYAKAGSYYTVTKWELGEGDSESLSQKDLNSHLAAYSLDNAQAMADANALHSAAFDSYDLRNAGVDLYAIDGCKTGTFGGITENRQADDIGGALMGYGDIQEVPGDGTVPLASADDIPIDKDKTYYALDADHGKMLSQNGISQEIVDIVSGSALSVPSDLVTQDASQCQLNGRVLSVYSPLSIDVTDSSGDHAGLASDGVSIENTIPNADYEMFGDHKFVYLPTDDGQTYSIRIAGTGTGTFTLTDAAIQDGSVVDTQVFGDVPVTPNLEGSMNMGDDATLSLDTDGNGTTDEILQPSATLDAADSADFYPADEIPSTATSTMEPSITIPTVLAETSHDPRADVASATSSEAADTVLASASSTVVPSDLLGASVIGSGVDGDRTLLLIILCMALPGWILLVKSIIMKK